MRASANQCRSSGWCTSTGERGGGAQHPGAADPGTDDRVDQGRLAGAGGPADDGEQRGVEGAQARQHVVVELVQQGGLVGPGSDRLDEVERQARTRDLLPQLPDGRDERLSVGARGRHRLSLPTAVRTGLSLHEREWRLMRLFVAINPPLPVVEDLEEFLGPMHEVTDGARWSASRQWHVTLAFMGSAPSSAVEPLESALASLVARVPAARLTVTGAVAFPNPYAARVLAVGVEDSPPGWLAGLARTVRSGCSVAGAAPEGGPFRPHLTLARFGRPTEATRWLRVVDTYRSEPFDVREVALVESHLSAGRVGRVRHDVLAAFPLAAP